MSRKDYLFLGRDSYIKEKTVARASYLFDMNLIIVVYLFDKKLYMTGIFVFETVPISLEWPSHF